MRRVRIIPRLDIKGPNVVKGIQLEGLRVVGNPSELARAYYNQGADELIYIDIVASLYNRNNLHHIIEETIKQDVFIPLTVGGGIRSLEDISKILRSGADKVAINTAAVKNPELLRKAARAFGSSTIVLSVEAKKVSDAKWEAYIDNGRERTGLDVIEWVKEGVSLGAGEVLITSVDREGTRKGYDLELINNVTSIVTVPVVASGGAGSIEDIENCINNDNVDGVTVASLLHYGEWRVDQIKETLSLKYDHRIKHNYRSDISLSNDAKVNISIVDYELGNLRSVKNAFRQLGAKVEMVNTAKDILKAKYLVLPGVGAFGEAMENLRKSSLDKAITTYALTGKPLLGICLGMQLLMTKSDEFGEHEGLCLIPGEVLAFGKNKDCIHKGYKVPHVGWNNVSKVCDTQGTVLEGLPKDIDAYFIHSFYVDPRDQQDVLGVTDYFEYKFCSVVGRGNVFGCQFHPEKSGKMGLAILKSFMQLSHNREVVNAN